MVAEPWLAKMGKSSKKSTKNKEFRTKNAETIGILSFEVANVMSKTVRLHKSLTSSEISKLKNEILNSDGVKALISSDETYLLDLALSEKLDELNYIAGVVSRLGKKCTIPQLQGFEHVFGDIISGAIEIRQLGILVKDMDSMVRRMEKYVNSTANLHGELEVLNELEAATKKFQQNQHEESRKMFEQKLLWHKQDVRHLKDVSLWNQTYDKIVEMLARTVCTLYARICFVFADTISRREMFVNRSSEKFESCRSFAQKSSRFDVGSLKSGGGISQSGLTEKRVVSANAKFQSCRSFAQKPGQTGLGSVKSSGFSDSSSVEKSVVSVRSRKGENQVPRLKAEDFNFACGLGPGKLFMECLSLSTSVSTLDDQDDVSVRNADDQASGCCSISSSVKRGVTNQLGFHMRIPMSQDRRGFKGNAIIQAPPNTIGGSALALHYANVVIVIEKLLNYPHLVGEEARDDLYQMLPTSLRLALKASLKSYVKDLAIYDAPLAHDWKDRLDGILAWLAPLAHNMIRWQSERNYEQQRVVPRTNVLLLQTLYFADRAKTEAAICELLVGLNYICRYEHQQNALLDCASSFDFDDCVEWPLQY